jgi:tetratricopeptide (TPR) repeat protein/peroxiredoxin
MKTNTKLLAATFVLIIGIVLGVGSGHAQLATGDSAPPFSLTDAGGKVYDLAAMKDRPLIILFYFDVDSRPSQEGLLSLNQLARQHKEADLTVWAITLSPKEKTTRFAAQSNLTFPVLLDTGKVSDLYGARVVLPTVCLIGPDLKMLDHIQGGGKTAELMLTRLAERELQRRQTALASALSDEAIKKNPEDLKARTVKGYAALKAGNVKEAEETFAKLAQKGGKSGAVGMEGLAAVHAKKGQQQEALQLAQEVERVAPERSYAHVIKGDILYAQGKKQEAEGEYQQAAQKGDTEVYLKPVGYNQLGRMYANAGKYDKARGLFDQAVAIDPYYVEGTTNKGRTFEKEGNWEKALESYRQAMTRDKADTFAAVLAKNAQEMVAIQRDAERKKRMDRLIKDLAERFRSQKKAAATKAEDTWTSFVDFQEEGGLSQRDGFTTVLTTQLADQLNASGRVQVVERVLVERLLEELNLGSSELADPETALKLGRVLAAKLIGTGAIFYLPDSTLLSLRLIDAETSAIPLVRNKPLASSGSMEKDLFEIDRDILKTVISKYPLRGFVVKAVGDQVMINLGAKQGVVVGTKFEALEEQQPVTYKGKVLQSGPKAFAEVEVVKVEPDLSYAKVVKQERGPKTDDKVQEKTEAQL